MMRDPAFRISRRMVIGAALALVAGGAAQARAPMTSLRPPPRPGTLAAPALVRVPSAPALDQILARANLSGALGFAALDADTGAVIEVMNPLSALPPASTAKAPTALYALHHLGPEHRFVTRALSRGGLSGGALNGDLVLVGGGDPNLQTADLAQLADRLVATGLRRVEGRFLVDESALPLIDSIDPAQLPQAGYSPALSGLNLNFNRVHFGWAVRGGQAQLALDARSDREQPPVSTIAIRVAERDLPVYSYDGSGAREEWRVARTALSGEGSRWLPVRRPGLYVGDVLRALLAARGCTLPAPQSGRAQPGDQVLAEHRSAPLTTILRDMLRFSTNITAECTGLAASLRAGASVARLSQSGAAMSRWLSGRYGLGGLSFVDHSGLGDASRVTAQDMAALMRAAHGEGMLAPLLREQTLRDGEGRALADHPLRVQAKTGTLHFASTLAGLATPRRGGRTIAFAILAADLPRRAAIPDGERERPRGAQGWSRRARALQQALVERWAALDA